VRIQDAACPQEVALSISAAAALARPCLGATIALSRETLSRIGGFEAVANQLADDYAIGKAVRQAGHRGVLPPLLVAHSCEEESLGEVVRHELRWARTISPSTRSDISAAASLTPCRWRWSRRPFVGSTPGDWRRFSAP